MFSPTSERVIIARHETTNGEIQLQQRPQPDGSMAFEIISNGVFLMASYNQVSEQALASHALKTIHPTRCSELRVLIGGLGMGFTAQETLAHSVTSVDVVEISPHIIEWNQTHFAPLNGNVLADPRVQLIQDDLYNVLLTSSVASYAAILLDVDNGPSWLAHEDNARLYTLDALEQWARLLVPSGVFAVWSAQPEPEFRQRMKVIFECADEVVILTPNHNQESVEYFIYWGLTDVVI